MATDIESDESLYWDLARRLYPHTSIEKSQHQGACSLTFLVDTRVRVKNGRTVTRSHRGTDGGSGGDGGGGGGPARGIASVLQFRPIRFATPLPIAHAARRAYGSLAPIVIDRGVVDVRAGDAGGHGSGTDERNGRDVGGEAVQICEMSKVKGSRLTELLLSSSSCSPPTSNDEEGPKPLSLEPDQIAKLTTLFEGLAHFSSLGWKASTAHGLDYCQGKVGSTLIDRLHRLERHLPSEPLRLFARRVREQVQMERVLDPLPVVIMHGDTVPSNLMVDPTTWELQGVVDWAEAEYLPFGFNLYCVEVLLGNLVRRGGEGGGRGRSEGLNHRFEYFEQAGVLRKAFYDRLKELIVEIEDEGLRCAIGVARRVGILLWFGFAWNDGNIDKVVDHHDEVELAYLDAFVRAEAA